MGLLDRIRRVAQLLGDPRAPRLPKAAVLLSIVYLIWPIDALPEWVFSIVGYLDDLVVMWLAVRWLVHSGRGLPAETQPEPPPRG